MRTILTTSITKLSSLFQIVEEHGINRTTLLERAGIDPLILNSPDNRLPLDQVYRLTQEAVSATRDDYLGLHQGERFMGFSNILGYVMMNCRNLRQAMEKLTQYQKICDEGTATELDIQNNTARVRVSILDATLENDRHLSDYRLSGTYIYLQKLTGTSFKLTEAWLHHPAPPQTGEYKRIFKCPVAFNRSMNAIIFDRRYLDLPIPEPNRELLKKFEQYAREVLDALTINDSYSNRTGRIIATMLQGETPSIEAVAGKMAMSVRNLQLKLQKEGTAYSRLLNNIRKDLAVSYLKDDAISITEIAYLLGYSEVSVFYRAFKQWVNKTPVQFRSTLAS